MKLTALYFQPISYREEEREIEVELDDVISYSYNEDGTYSMHIHTRYGDTELVKLTQASYIYLAEMLEDYHNPNKFGSRMK